MYEFGEYLPDLPELLNPGLTKAENILPGEIGYLSFPSLVAVTTTPMSALPQGIFTARDPSAVGVTHIYTGDATKLYQVDGTAFTDISGSTYTIAEDDRWDFAQYGNQVIATDFADNVQVQTIGGGNFADLTGSPPKARAIGVVDNFVVLGNTNDAVDGDQPQRVRWSGIGSATSWAVSPITQAGFNDLFNNGGFIQRIVGGDYGLIFQERAITRMTYIGSPVIFQFDQLETERGAYAKGGVVAIGNNVAYLAEDGFFVFDGYQSIPIGRGKVDRTFFAEVNKTYLHRISATIYPGEQIIAWSYPTNASASGIPDKILFYNYSPGAKTRWSYALVDHSIIGSPLSQGFTLDGLDAVSTNIDALPAAPPNDISLDSDVWAGLQKIFGAINTTFNLGFFNGAALAAVIETGEMQLSQPKRTSVTNIRPYVDTSSGTVTVQMSGRDNESSAGTFQTAVSLNASGFAPVRINNRLLKARINITGGFNHAEGLDLIQATPVGLR